MLVFVGCRALACKMRKCWLFALLLLLLVPGCREKQKVKPPQVLLTEQQMVDVLSDTYLIEAELNQMKSEGKEVGTLQNTYYEQLFAHYGITDSIFQENMKYYSYHLVELERIMDSVMNRFLKAQGK